MEGPLSPPVALKIRDGLTYTLEHLGGRILKLCLTILLQNQEPHISAFEKLQCGIYTKPIVLGHYSVFQGS